MHDAYHHAPSLFKALHLLTRLARLALPLVAVVTACLIGVEALDVEQQEVLKTRTTQEARKTKAQALPPLLIPEPLPFPAQLSVQDQVPYRFKVPNAEFTLEARAPRLWGWKALSGEVVRLAPSGPESPEPKSVVTVSTGCFGPCDDLSRNIANALITHLRTLSRQGVNARVVHWHVHHASWLEYSLLTDNAEGQAQLTGVTLRWEDEWLNALRCEMSAPIELPFEHEEVLHLAWDLWAPLFVSRCRELKVLSWE